MVGEELGVMCRARLAWTLWWLGYPTQALQRMREALSLAEELKSPFNLACAFFWAAVLHQFRREMRLTQERAEALLALSREHGFLAQLGLGSVLQGWAQVEQSQTGEGIAQIRQGVSAYRATGGGRQLPYFLALLAEACGKAGHTEEGLTALSEALDLVSESGERECEAELHWLKGHLTLQKEFDGQGSAPKSANPRSAILNLEAKVEAEACFLRAIEIARRQRAKCWELRAVMSLSRLWQRDKKNEAREMLSDIYSWFTEGFDTVDLKDAKALLDELNG